MYPFKYHLRRHIILGEWERIARVAPKAASNRYPYLFSHCCRAQIFKYYKSLRRHIILEEWERIACVAPKAASNRYPYFVYCCCRAQIFKYYKSLRRHIIYIEGKSVSERVSSFYYLFLKSIFHFMWIFRSRLC